MDKLTQLLELDVSKLTEKRGKFTYLSWANAWKEFVKVHPTASYTVLKDSTTHQCWHGNAEQGYMVYTSVTVDGLTHEMWLPVMDFNNKAMMTPTTFDVNKAVMRCLTKNLAMFGLGLYIYAGEDLPVIPKPTNIDCTDLINVGYTKGYDAKTIEKSLVHSYGHGMEFVTKKEHDESLAKLTALPDKEEK